MIKFKTLDIEERYNTLSHAIGILCGIIGLVLLVLCNTNKTVWSLFSVIVYACSFILLFTASTLYHCAIDKRVKEKLRILDHISIYILIAGTYTPVLLIALPNSLGYVLLSIVWLIACFGVVLKLFYTGRFETFSLLLYLIMGWLIVLDFSNLTLAIGSQAIFLLVLGGVLYSVGIIFYAVNKIPYNHFIWHLFVLAGAISHFFMILCHVV